MWVTVQTQLPIQFRDGECRVKWPGVLRALESRNYRLFFIGQVVSLIGTWMTQTASLWLVYRLSSSPLLLGVVGFASQAPIFFLAPIAGVLADRFNRHRLLVLTQILSMVQSFALAALTLTGHINSLWLVGLSFVQGAINGVDLPTRQALVVAFVNRREHLGNAIALNSSMFNLARLAGPAIGGFVIAAYGAGVCYVIDGFSYAAVILSLLLMRLALPVRRANPAHPLADMRDGFAAAFTFRPMRVLIITIALISAVGFSYSVLTPLFARDVFSGDARVLGYLMSASGIGALVGAVYLSTRTTIRGLGAVVALGCILMGVGLLGFAFSRWLGISLMSLGIVGLGGVLTMASSNTVVQTLVSEEQRGRTMSIFTMAFTGTMPVGNLLVGWIAGFAGPAVTLMASGSICILVGLAFYRMLPGLRAAAAPILARVAPLETVG
jgi:MFS family permease